MSKRSEEYVNELTACPDGFRINCAHKAILGVLSECHSPVRKTIWPSMEYIAMHACVPMATAKRKMKELEDHLVIERVRPENQGRGQMTEYIFLEIDAPQRLRQKMLTMGLGDGFESAYESNTKGAQNEPLLKDNSEGERGSEGAQTDTQKGVKRGSEGAHRGFPYKEEPGTGNRVEPGSDSPELPPEGFNAIELARGVLEQIGVPMDFKLLDIVGQSITILSREEKSSVAVAAQNIIDRGLADKSGGVTINRFWFSDQRFLQRKTATMAASVGGSPRRYRTPADKLAEQDEA